MPSIVLKAAIVKMRLRCQSLGCVQTDCCVRVASGVQTDATTPNNVGTYSASWDTTHKSL